MSFTARQLEEMAGWCSGCAELATIRASAWRMFFGEDDPRPVHYWPGVGDVVGRQRRFIGWFMLAFTLPDGRHPAQLAVERLYDGSERLEALKAVDGARYVLAIVTSVIPGHGLFLEIERESLEVRSKPLSHVFERGKTLISHLVPVRLGQWIPGPGWLEWPTIMGPNMRKELMRFQPDPISVERLLQTRSDRPEGMKRPEHPRDATLEQAVARMTEAALAEGRSGLVMSPEEWKLLVVKHLDNPDMTAFSRELTGKIGEVKDMDELNRWLALATNIWNTTPQPDRGGRTAYEMAKEEMEKRRQG
ncbi:MAG: hypothetical protein Q8P22_11430 [Chloroflexota bacterium]|nr:hypothetical protein [Chloroflexota bacterium]